MKSINDGERFGRLIISQPSQEVTTYHIYVSCICDCGNEKVARLDHLISGATKSCGCISKENPPARKHGMRHSKEYSIWCDMKKRCSNKNAQNYKYYGGRGIKVCDEWNQSFESFIKDMGLCPTKTSSIERINNELGYCNHNCKWIEMSDQAANRGNSVFIERNRKNYSIRQIATLLSLDYKKIYRLYKKDKKLSSLSWDN